MDTQFWIDRWSNSEIGFHQTGTNEYLERYWAQLQVPAGTSVFVPLCGKSLDMHWLREHGHPVIGVEVARDAVASFFQEWGVDAEVTGAGAFEHWRAPGIDLLCGDFFALTASHLVQVRGVFDRAALIALPAPLRRQYAAKMREILPSRTRTLLVTADYAQEQMSGPPFAVSDSEMKVLFGESHIRMLAEVDVTEAPDNARFRQRGLTNLLERVYRID